MELLSKLNKRLNTHFLLKDLHLLSSIWYIVLFLSGYGLRCHRAVITLCKLIGIEDMYAKVDGSVNLLNITRALFHGLANQVRDFRIRMSFIAWYVYTNEEFVFVQNKRCMVTVNLKGWFTQKCKIAKDLLTLKASYACLIFLFQTHSELYST